MTTLYIQATVTVGHDVKTLHKRVEADGAPRVGDCYEPDDDLENNGWPVRRVSWSPDMTRAYVQIDARGSNISSLQAMGFK